MNYYTLNRHVTVSGICVMLWSKEKKSAIPHLSQNGWNCHPTFALWPSLHVSQMASFVAREGVK